MTDTPTMSEAAVKPSSADVTRVVRDGVVSVARREYTHPIFLELEGRKVGLRPVENSANEMHVFVDGRWAGDAGRVGLLPDTPIEHHPAIRYQEDEQRSLGGARLVETENFILCDHAVAAGAEDLEMVACYARQASARATRPSARPAPMPSAWGCATSTSSRTRACPGRRSSERCSDSSSASG